METVRSDQRKERRKGCRTIRTRTFNDQVMEFIDFHDQKRCAEQEGNAQPEQNACTVIPEH
ncbi:hypothetical protein D9M69_697790 [compost metagenome]